MKKIVLSMILLCYVSVVVAKNRNSSVLGFIENKGQIIDQYYHLNEQVKFIGVCNGIKVQLKVNSFSYEVLKIVSSSKYQVASDDKRKHSRFVNDSTIINSHRIDVELINSNPNPQIIKEGKSVDYLNYYTTSTPENGITEVHYYNKVSYKDIYPYIDLEFVTDASLKQPYKYNFIIYKGGNINDIQMHFKGANQTELSNGNINIESSFGLINENIPLSYEIESGREVAVKFSKLGKDIYGFDSTKYNNQNTLIIDPWATYFGGNNTEEAYGISCDNVGNVYGTGITHSTSNIATTGVFQNVLNGSDDAYIVKFDAVGNRVWATYYGGSSHETGFGVTCDNNNNVIITGECGSNNVIASLGAYQTTYAGNGDIFIAKFNANGIRIWGTYYGSIGADRGLGITSDNVNNIIVVGESSSSGLATLGAHQTTLTDGEDGIVIKLDSNGNRLWATYYGGTNVNISDEPNSVATDNIGSIIVSGLTDAQNNISTTGSHQVIYGGGFDDGFMVKFNSAGVRQWGTYFGGSHEDEIRGVAVDASNNIVIGGFTGSPNNIATPGSFKSTTTTANAFVAKFTSTGTRIWGTYYGGTGNGDYGNAVAVGDSNNIVLTGNASSLDSIATPGSYKDTLTIGPGSVIFDAFLVKFDSNGNRLWGTYYGGEGDEDISNGVAVDNHGNILITGNTNSFTGIATPNAFQTTPYDSSYDAFIASFSNSGKLTTAISNLNNPAKNNLLQVYPNPAKEKITVSVKEFGGKAGSLVLMDIEGKAVKSVITLRQAQGDKDIVIDVKDLSAGVYLLQYDDGEVCETVKFVKE